MGCIRESAKGFKSIVNVIVIVLGLALAALGGYLVYLQYSGSSDYTAHYFWVPFVILAAGLFISLFACCATRATMHERRCAMMFFAIFQFVFGVAFILTGVEMINVATDGSLIVPPGQSGADAQKAFENGLSEFEKWLAAIGADNNGEIDTDQIKITGIVLTVFGSLLTVASILNALLACCKRRNRPVKARETAV